jgi:hypothetical protein
MEDFNYSNWKLRETQQRNRRLAVAMDSEANESIKRLAVAAG